MKNGVDPPFFSVQELIGGELEYPVTYSGTTEKSVLLLMKRGGDLNPFNDTTS
jgi:hypothetical protein